MRRAIDLTIHDIMLDRESSERRRNNREWERAKVRMRLEDGYPSEFGNWHFGSVVEHAINLVMIEFPEIAQTNLRWEAFPKDGRDGRRYCIMASL